jgi:transposase
LLLNRKEKEKRVIQLAKEGKTTRQIAKILHMSLRDIGKIIAKETGDYEADEIDKQRKEVEREKQIKWKSLSPYARAFQMFKDGRELCRCGNRT